MRRNFLKTTSLTATMTLAFIFSLTTTNAFAGTLTETLRNLFNKDMPDYFHSAKLQLDTFEVMPIRSVSVKGDAAKFRAINWMNDGITGGIKEMGFDGDIGKGDKLSFEGHAIPGDNDFGASFNLTKGNGGYITMDYGNFRKWYDVYGGYYSNFTAQPISKLSFEPKMDMGHFSFEIGSGSEKDPGISLRYDRDTKVGTKSTLAWGSVVEGVTRKILPSWQRNDHTTDTIALKGNVDVAGFNVNGQQRAEFFNAKTYREDAATTTTVSSHDQNAYAKNLTTALRADRWVLDDKTYVNFGYRYQHLRNDMLDNMKQSAIVIDAYATSDSHAWVQNFTTQLAPDLNFLLNFKEEIINNTGVGDYWTAPSTYSSVQSENGISQTGQSLSLRYGGIPKTSLYTDWDFQQTRNSTERFRRTTSNTNIEYVERSPETTGVIGIRYVHNSKLNLTSQLKYQSKNETYNMLVNNDPGIYISRLAVNSNEWNNRLTWKPLRWFQNSFRLQLVDKVYRQQSLNQPAVTPELTNFDWIKSQSASRVYTYDAILQPWDEWMFNVGGSLNQFKVSTPASQVAVSGGGIPVFTANVYTLLFSASYAPKENFSIYSSAQYSRANDFNSQGFDGIPYGVNNESYDITIGAKWSPKKNLTLEPHYGYYSYRANPNDNYSMDYGNYTAHVVWLDTKFTW